MRSNSSCRLKLKCSHIVLRIYLPCFFMVYATRSLTIGTQPPQPEPAFVHFLTSSACSHPCCVTASHICALVMPSQLQISALSGRASSPAPAGLLSLCSPKRDRKSVV